MSTSKTVCRTFIFLGVCNRYFTNSGCGAAIFSPLWGTSALSPVEQWQVGVGFSSCLIWTTPGQQVQNGHSSTPNISWHYAGWGSAPTSVLRFFSVFKHWKGGKVQDLSHAIEHCKVICGCWGVLPSTAGLWLKPLISSITSQNSGTGTYMGKVAALCSQPHGSTLTFTESGLRRHGCKKVIRPFTAMWLIWKMSRIILINDRWCQRGRNCI